MRIQRPLFALLFLLELLTLPFPVSASYQVAPSTGSGLPYSLETKNLLKHLYNNRRIVGGQVIALKDQPGKNYSGNYIDVGDLGGVKKGDVFALFTPQGEPVGFLRVVETQHYTSSFEFVELTVDPSDNLSAKKITEEVKGRLPESLLVYPDMKRFKKGTQLALKKQKPLPPGIKSASQPSLPPLPGETSAPSTTPSLPPLPGENASVSTGSSLPPLPETGAASTGGSTLPPLPMDNSSTLGASPAGGQLPALPTADSGAGLPPLNPDNSNPGAGLPPLGGDSSAPPLPGQDNGLSGLPALPTDNSPAPGSLPPLSNDNGLPPLSNTAPDSGLPALPGDNSGAPPALPPPGPGGVDSGLPPLPGADSSMPALPMDNSSSLPPLGNNPPGADMSLPPIPNNEPANNGAPLLPPQSEMMQPPSPMADNSGLPDSSAVPPMLDSGLPSLPDAGMPPPAGLAQAPLDNGLPPMDNGSAPPPLSGDMSLPPMADSALPPPSSDMALPPMADSSLPPVLPDASSTPELPPPAVASSLPMENGPASAPPSLDAMMPPLADNSLPQVPDEMPPTVGAANPFAPPVLDNTAGMPQGAIPDINSQASLPPSGVPGSPDLSFPPLAAQSVPSGTSASNAANLSLPAVPSEVKSGFLQDLPTLSSAKKPAA